ncbi:hypothetical protein GGS21DRAFT_304409 [Xylaria nigripes]|nr:hypothetical protein GGS21DRAFT_304409 [Xylaria nigripes]
MMARFFIAATLVNAVQALAFDGKPALVTAAVIPDATFHLPAITPAPDVREMFKRQANDQTVLIAPDNTCGYVSGRPGAPFTCNGGNTCAFVFQSAFGAVGCCDSGGTNCGVRATCLDFKQVYMSSACDNGCLQDTFTAKCTNSALPYCGTVTFFSGVRDFYCDSLSISTPQQLYTTYSGQTGRSFQQVLVSSTLSENGSPILSNTESASPSGSNNSGGNNNHGSDNNDSSHSSSSAPVGAIVGGVVGGVGAFTLIGLATFFIIRHNNKKDKKNKDPNANQSMQQAAAAGGMGPAPAAPGYPQQTYGQQPYQHPSTQPQGYSAGEQKPTGFVSMSPTGVPDRYDSTSPVSQMSDPRQSVQPHSPTASLNGNWGAQPGAPNVPPTVHEAGGNVIGERDYHSNHRGQFHEMA